MSNRQLVDQNRVWWRQNAGRTAQGYLESWSGFHLRREIKNGCAAVDAGLSYTNDAYKLHMGGWTEHRDALLERAIELIDYALAGDRIYDDVRNIYEQPQVHEQKVASYQMMGLRCRGEAAWLLHGIRPDYTFVESAKRAEYVFNIQKSFIGWSSIESLLVYYARARMYDAIVKTEASERAAFDINPIGGHPRSGGPSKSLVIVAGYALGASELERVASREIDSWYKRALKWETFTEFSLSDRLVWAWLRAELFTHRTDIQEILDELRGF